MRLLFVALALLVSLIAFAAGTGDNSFIVGNNSSTAEKKIYLGKTNIIRVPASGGNLQYSNDSGSTYENIGSGGGLEIYTARITGASISTGSSAQSTLAQLTNASLSLTRYIGSLDIACTGSETPSDTTCTSSAESVGVSWTADSGTIWKTCVQFTRFHDQAASSQPVQYYRVVETENTSATILQDVGEVIGTGGAVPSAQNSFSPMRVCSNFEFSSGGRKTVRLMYTQTVSGTVTTAVNADGTYGRSIYWTVQRLK